MLLYCGDHVYIVLYSRMHMRTQTDNSIFSDLAATGMFDIQLSAESDTSRGCGGVGISWHKSIGATPVDGNLVRLCVCYSIFH